MSELKTETFICECNSLEHMVYVTYDEDTNDLYFHIHLNQYLGFWGRLKCAVKYLFGKDSDYGCWDTILISPDDKERLMNIIKDLKSNQEEMDKIFKQIENKDGEIIKFKK